MNLEEIAALVGGTVKGDGKLAIEGVAPIDRAGDKDLTYLTRKSYLEALKSSLAAAVIVDREMAIDKAQIIHPNPQLAFARVLARLHPDPKPEPHIHPRSVVGKNVSLGDNVTVGALAVIGDNVSIGDETVIHPGAVVGDDCRIGGHCTIHPNVTLYRRTQVGNHVILHAGVVIGADGFGYTPDEQGRHFKINQIGNVVIEDHVEIGANSCVDRAAMGSTVVREGAKIDNLVQVAHNCRIGEHSILVAQVGLAGSCELGHHVVLAGQVGLADHVKLGDQVTLTAQSGTFRDVESNSVQGGSPSVPLNTWKKYVTTLPKLPEMAKTMKDLEKRVNAIEKQSGGE